MRDTAASVYLPLLCRRRRRSFHYCCRILFSARETNGLLKEWHVVEEEVARKKEQHYAIYVYTLRHAMICQRPEAKNTRARPFMLVCACAREQRRRRWVRVQIHYTLVVRTKATYYPPFHVFEPLHTRVSDDLIGLGFISPFFLTCLALLPTPRKTIS